MKRFLEEIGQDASLFTSLFDFTKDLVFLMEVGDGSLCYIYVNPSALRVLNLENSVVGKRIEEVLPHTQSHLLLEKYTLVQKTQKPIEFIQEIENDSGVFIGETALSPVLTRNGECKYILAIVRDMTESKQNERKLKESQKKLHSLLEHNGDAVFELDLNGNFVNSNRRATEITGWEKEEFFGNSSEFFLPNESSEETLSNFEKALGGTPVEYEATIYHKNGGKILFYVKNVPIFIDEMLVGVYGIAEDITAEKQLQDDIRIKNEELSAFWNNSVDPIFLFDRNGKIQRFNPAFASLFEIREGDILDINEIIPQEMKDEPRKIVQKIVEKQTIALYRTKRITRSGTVLDILASFTPAKDKEGNIVGAYAFYKNVTELTKAENELRKSEEKYRLITDNAFDVIKLINPSGIIEYVSPSNEKILGYQDSEYMGLSYINHIHPEDVPSIEYWFHHLMKGKKPLPKELRVRHKNGHYIWMEVITTPVIEDGEVQQLVTIARDITERKRFRDELERAAYCDYLTGLPNRRVFHDRLNTAIYHASQTNKKVAVMMLDGRKFKQINDTFGHDAGDAVIVEMAKRLQSCVRDTDTVVRMGGDEMAIILPGIDSVDVVEEIANRIIGSFDELIDFHDVHIKMGAGIGIALYPDHTLDKVQLVKCADKALYEAKESDKNEFRIYQV